MMPACGFAIMRELGVDACVFTSMHNIAIIRVFYIAALAGLWIGCHAVR